MDQNATINYVETAAINRENATMEPVSVSPASPENFVLSRNVLTSAMKTELVSMEYVNATLDLREKIATIIFSSKVNFKSTQIQAKKKSSASQDGKVYYVIKNYAN